MLFLQNIIQRIKSFFKRRSYFLRLSRRTTDIDFLCMALKREMRDKWHEINKKNKNEGELGYYYAYHETELYLRRALFMELFQYTSPTFKDLMTTTDWDIAGLPLPQHKENSSSPDKQTTRHLSLVK